MAGLKTWLRAAFLTVFTTGFLCGLLLGIVGHNALISSYVDEYHRQLNTLQAALKDSETRLSELEESMNKRSFVVKDVKIYLDFEGDALERVTLEEVLEDKYRKLIGKEVRSVDVDLLAEVADKRILRLNNKQYQSRIDKLVVSETVQIWLQVRPLSIK